MPAAAIAGRDRTKDFNRIRFSSCLLPELHGQVRIGPWPDPPRTLEWLDAPRPRASAWHPTTGPSHRPPTGDELPVVAIEHQVNVTLRGDGMARDAEIMGTWPCAISTQSREGLGS
jgi:hypothetical protein